MGFIFKVDTSRIRRLGEIYEASPKKFSRAAGMLINNFAFGTRDMTFDVLPTVMTIRSAQFVRRQIRVSKANLAMPLDAMRSEVGSVRAPRFTGWQEQETGKATERKRVFTLLGRKGGAKRGLARPAARLRNIAKFESPDDYPGKSSEHRVIVMLRTLQRNKHRRPFIIHGHRKIHPGVYQFSGRATKGKPRPIRIMHVFKPDRVQPRRIPWMRMSRNRYLSSIVLIDEWRRVLNRVWTPRNPG